MATEILRPDEAGDECNIEHQTGATCPNHYQNVDEETPDEDTTRVFEDAESYKRDLYNCVDHSVGSGTINKITVYARCKASSTPVDFASLKICIKSGTGAGVPDTVDESSEIELTLTTYFNYSNEWATNPATALAWTWDEIDKLQIGISIKQNSVFGDVTYCTQVYVEVDYTVVPVDVTIDVPLVVMESAGLVPTPSLGVTLSAPLVAVDSAGLVPTLSLGVTLSPPVAAIDSQALAGTLALDRIFDSPIALVDLEALVPEIIVEVGVIIEPPVAMIDSEALVPSLLRDMIFPVPTALIDSEGLVPEIVIIWPPSIMGRRTAYDGYRCFIEQYVRNKLAGSPPLKLPDGTLW